LLTSEYPAPQTSIQMSVRRNNVEVFSGETQIANMKQTFDNLREHLFRSNSFPNGCYLMTGTGIVPGDDFTLESQDEISITVDQVGILINVIECMP
jgi:2-dehydro-3-deoxy-D-arabinonate dehydratase